MSSNPMKKPAKPRKHLSQLDPTGRARAEQVMQFALLAIVQSQGKAVDIPYGIAEKIFDTHRLKITIDGGMIRLEAEKQGSQIVQPGSALVQ